MRITFVGVLIVIAGVVVLAVVFHSLLTNGSGETEKPNEQPNSNP